MHENNQFPLLTYSGTGKTYVSAFAMRELGFKRVLFLVHRVTLAKQAKKSFEKVFDKKVTMGLVGAGFYEYDKDYVFATVETLNRDTHLFQYQPDAFDCIILDEAYHSSNNIYTKVINYFNPKLFLGMTATPDKRDDNQEGKIYMRFSIIKSLMKSVYSRQWKIIFFVHFIILASVRLFPWMIKHCRLRS